MTDLCAGGKLVELDLDDLRHLRCESRQPEFVAVPGPAAGRADGETAVPPAPPNCGLVPMPRSGTGARSAG